MRKVCGDFEAELREFNGEAHDVHLLVLCAAVHRQAVHRATAAPGLADAPLGMFAARRHARMAS
jgi:hypothetical protein